MAQLQASTTVSVLATQPTPAFNATQILVESDSVLLTGTLLASAALLNAQMAAVSGAKYQQVLQITVGGATSSLTSSSAFSFAANRTYSFAMNNTSALQQMNASSLTA